MPDAQAFLSIRVFGPFAAELGAKPLSDLTHREMALLAVLALHQGELLSKEWVIEQLWPGEGRGMSLLNKLVQEVEAPLAPLPLALSPVPGKLRLDAAAATVDAIELDTAWQARDAEPEALARAVELVRGPLLQDWERWWDDREWVLRARDRYASRHREAIQWLAAKALRANDLDAALRCAQELRQLSDMAEPLHSEIMSELMRSEQFVQASQFYEEYRDGALMPRRLLPPRGMTAMYEQIPRRSSRVDDAAEPELVEEEPIGGAMRLDSRYYIDRPSDHVVHSAVKRRDCIVRIQGPRQTGKTSLLARSLDAARRDGALVVTSDFQSLGPQDTETIESFFLALAQQFHHAARTASRPSDFWDTRLSANANFQGYLRDVVLDEAKRPVVWGIDEADRIFDRPYRSSVFGLFRSWHNRRSLEPDEGWGRFTLVMAYSSEARMLIPNPNESPFNVGTGANLQDFTSEQVVELNERYDRPLADPGEVDRLVDLVGGHPFLVRTCLYEIKTRPASLEAIEHDALSDGGLFAEHLDRVLRTATHDAERRDCVVGVLGGEPCHDRDTFSRLRSAGVLAGDSADQARIRCGLYAIHLQRRLL